MILVFACRLAGESSTCIQYCNPFCQESYDEDNVYFLKCSQGKVSSEHFHSQREEKQICLLKGHHLLCKSLSLKQYAINLSFLQHTEMERRVLLWGCWLKAIRTKFISALCCLFTDLKICTVKSVFICM